MVKFRVQDKELCDIWTWGRERNDSCTSYKTCRTVQEYVTFCLGTGDGDMQDFH